MESKSEYQKSINLIADSFVEGSFKMDLLKSLTLKNSLYTEIRLFAWYLFLGVFTRDSTLWGWYKLIKTERETFIKYKNEYQSNNPNMREIIELFENREFKPEKYNSYLNTGFFNEILFNEIWKIKLKYFLSNSEYFLEVLLWNYAILYNYKGFDSEEKVINLLAATIYILYPGITETGIHFEDLDEESINAENFFYFLNDKQFFESNIFIILNRITRDGSFMNYVCPSSMQSIHSIPREIEYLENLIPDHPKFKNIKLQRIENICYVLLQIANKRLLKNLLSNNIDLFEIVNDLFGYMLSNSIDFQNLKYLWDNIFMNSYSHSLMLEFLDFIIVAMIDLQSNKFIDKKKDFIEKVMSKYPAVGNQEIIDIVTRALKIRETFESYKFKD